MCKIVLKCDKCNRFYVAGEKKDIGCIDNFKNCGGKMFDTGMKFDEYLIVSKISKDDDFLNAMIDLKEKDPIEFQLKMSQFKTQVQQQESIKTQNDNTPRCPHCKSTNIKSISGLNRGASIAMWGIFSKKINKSFECKQCGYTW